MTAVSRQKGWAAVFLTGVLSVFGVAVAPGQAAAAPVPGAVLSATVAALPPELAPLATAKRVQYVSTNVSGATITVTGLVITPRTNRKFKTVAWAHGTTGLADQCAPSTSAAVFWPEARAAIAELLKRGWTVAATDYPGLGTAQLHPYLVGASEARAIIDSVKAARNLDPALGVQYAIDGHSQGGQGGLFAGELAPSYDGVLVLRGVAAIAPVSNVDQIAPFIPGTPGQGYLVMALYGLAVVETSFSPLTVLAPPARQRAAVLRDGCLLEILDAYAPLTANELIVNGTLPQSVIDRLALHDNPVQLPPSAPILIVQGTADEAVPYDITLLLVDQLHAYNQPVRFETIQGANHDGAVFASVQTVANWISVRFLG